MNWSSAKKSRLKIVGIIGIFKAMGQDENTYGVNENKYAQH